MNRNYVCSDIHGHYDKWRALLTALDLRPDDTLYVLGDMIDRGPDGVKVLQDMMLRPNVIPILGNHEMTAAVGIPTLLKEITDESLAELNETDVAVLSDWLRNGGGPTLRGLRSIPPEERQDLLEYLHDMELYAEVEAGGRDFVLIHAAPELFDPDKPLEDYEPQELLFGRPDPSAEFWPDKYLVYGHTPTRLLRERLGEPPSDDILRRGRQIAIDCACAYDGKLGCLCLDTLEEIYV